MQPLFCNKMFWLYQVEVGMNVLQLTNGKSATSLQQFLKLVNGCCLIDGLRKKKIDGSGKRYVWCSFLIIVCCGERKGRKGRKTIIPGYERHDCENSYSALWDLLPVQIQNKVYFVVSLFLN